MAEAKIEIKVGAVSFTGEGEGKWLSDQLDKILEKLPSLSKVAPPAPPSEGSGGGQPAPHHGKAHGTLASFLAAKAAKTDKTRKFLAAALWLQDTQSKNRLSTSDVKKAVNDNKQGPLGNASQSLTNNAKRGFCLKEGRQFYVTDEGRAEIG